MPNRFTLTVDFNVSAKSNVAAEWKMTFTFSVRIWRSDSERPKFSSPTSPAIALTRPNAFEPKNLDFVLLVLKDNKYV